MAAFFLLLALASSLAVGGMAQGCGSDPAILNFALNLEYLEANFYSCAAFGHPISQDLWGTNGVSPEGCVKATLSAKARDYAETIAMDELKHVIFLRTALGAAAVDQPLIDLGAPFVAAANLALNTTLDPPFTYYANDVLFYHAAFIFEDVGVTAYKGAAALITCKDYLTAAAGILAVEAYHGGAIRSLLLDINNQVAHPYGAKVRDIVQAISNLRALASGEDDDRGLLSYGNGYIVAPGDVNGVAFSRNTSQVLNIVYLTGAGRGGFFPNGLNGAITHQ